MKNLENRRTSERPRVYKTTRCVKQLIREGKEVGEIITKTQIYLTEIETRGIIDKMQIHEQIHMKECAYPVYIAKKTHKINSESYLSGDTLMIYAADKGFNNIKDIKDNDPTLAKLIKKRGLVDELLQDFLPKTAKCVENKGLDSKVFDDFPSSNNPSSFTETLY